MGSCMRVGWVLSSYNYAAQWYKPQTTRCSLSTNNKETTRCSLCSKKKNKEMGEAERDEIL